MATQDEVINAFTNFEDSPRRASNLEIRSIDEYRDALCGGRNADDVVFAVRCPVLQLRLYDGRVRIHNNRMSYDYLRRQERKVRRAFDNLDDDNVMLDRSDMRPPNPDYIFDQC